MKVAHSETLKGDVDEVFVAFEDPEVIAAWQDNMLEFEMLEGEFNEQGGVAHMRVKQMEMTNDLTVKVVERDAGEHLVKYSYDGAQAPFTITNTFVDNGDGTTEWTAELEARISRLLKPLELALKPLAGKLVSDNGKNFRGWCDENF
jgi:uncharacterized protein YndB with AHSA1/START domain